MVKTGFTVAPEVAKFRIMKHLTLFVLFFTTLLSAGPFPESAVAVRIVGGTEVTIRGVINLITVPISDDYEMEPTGIGYYLITPYPHEAEGRDINDEDILEKNLTMFQLTGDDEVNAKLKESEGVPVEIIADPFPAHTRHHRTPFVLFVKSIRALDK